MRRVSRKVQAEWLSNRAKVLMGNLNLKYQRSSEVTLDKYLFTYGSTLEPSEFDEVVYLLVEISNN